MDNTKRQIFDIHRYCSTTRDCKEECYFDIKQNWMSSWQGPLDVLMAEPLKSAKTFVQSTFDARRETQQNKYELKCTSQNAYAHAFRIEASHKRVARGATDWQWLFVRPRIEQHYKHFAKARCLVLAITTNVRIGAADQDWVVTLRQGDRERDHHLEEEEAGLFLAGEDSAFGLDDAAGHALPRFDTAVPLVDVLRIPLSGPPSFARTSSSGVLTTGQPAQLSLFAADFTGPTPGDGRRGLVSMTGSKT